MLLLTLHLVASSPLKPSCLLIHIAVEINASKSRVGKGYIACRLHVVAGYSRLPPIVVLSRMPL
jgi:hypothetical protein